VGTRSVHALVIAGMAAWMGVPLTADGRPDRVVTVRLYQTADPSSTIEPRAHAEADKVLRPALVTVLWRPCSGADRSAACDRPAVRSELSVRIVRHRAVRPRVTTVLGDAFVAPGRGGVLATVYVDEVEELARVAGIDPAVLFGRAAAHEIGHLLMRTSAHARYGLMRDTWTEQEVHRNQPLDWMFTAGDVVAMRRFWPPS
jgi:hypothetical protein